MSENKLVNAYNAMVTNLHEDLADASKTLARGLDAAREKVSELGGLTQEEVHKVSDFVKRDIEEAAHSLTDDSNDSLSTWLKFDIEMIEDFALDAFMSVADKTRLQLAQIEQMARQTNTYESGDITGPGTFTCTQCDKEISFKTTSEMPECPACGNKTFQRC